MKRIILNRTRHFFILLTGILFFNPLLQAQDDLKQQIPVDDQIRKGKLDNGFTYYIRKNAKPEKRVEMRLVVKAGSVMEDEDQRGLAHFNEHMAFNGTKNFAKNELVHYMQSVGVQFGPEVNAQTSFNETIYMLTLPTDSVHILEKGFQIMEDWAHNISFDPTEIDKERGIIVEEWRLHQGLSQRLLDKLYPVLFEGSQYAVRIPIGKKEIIEGAPYATIKRFYTDWYRPDLMAFVVVGDIDPDAMEKNIREHFGSLSNPANPKVRSTYPVPDHKGTKMLLFTDKEMPVIQLVIFNKLEPQKYVLLNDYRKSLIYGLITSMLTQRFNELRELPDPPFMGAQAAFANMMPEKSLYQFIAVVPEKSLEKGVKALATEIDRALKYGFTEGELKRQKSDMLNAYENAYNEREKTNSVNYAEEYLRNFLVNEPIPGIAFEYDFAKKYLPGITLEEINEVLNQGVSDDNRVLAILSPQKDGLVLPDDATVEKWLDEANSAEILPYQDKMAGSQLLNELPKKGRVLMTRKNEKIGTIEMKLSNGAKVVLKPTDFKNDQVLFSSFSPGGSSVYDDKDHYNASFAADIINECGLGDFSPSDLNKLLAGKNVSVTPYIDDYFEGISGSAVPKDLETMFQLSYLYFTHPRKDSAMFASMMDIQKTYFKNALSSPETYFSDQFTRAITQNHPRADVIPTGEQIDQVNIDRVYEIYNDRFSDVSDFTFFIVGSFNVDSIKPLIETYLASLPATKRVENWKDLGIRPPAKKTDLMVHKGNDPKSRIGLYFEINEPWSEAESHVFESLGQLLQIRYLDVIREELSGAYTISSNARMGKIPYERAVINIVIPCSPDNVDKLTTVAINEIKSIQKKGVKPEDMVKIKEGERRDLESNMRENGFWLSQLITGYRYNDPELITHYSDFINNLNSERIQEAAKKMNLGKYVRVVLLPE